MNLPVSTNATMTTLDLRALVNEARQAFGEPLVRNDQFLLRVEDELGDELEGVQKFYTPLHGNQVATYDLTRDQCMLVAMRESKGVRRRVVDKLNAMERPQTAAPAELSRMQILQLAMESEQARIQAETERDQAIATKAQIGSRREATAMAKASAAVREVNRLRGELGRGCQFATITAVETATGGKYPMNAYVALRRWCRVNGVDPDVVPDARFGKVKAWPAGAWLDVYEIDLAALFGAAGECA